MCEICNDMGFILDTSGPTVVYSGRCECQIQVFNKEVWEYLYNRIPEMNRVNMGCKLNDKQLAILHNNNKKLWVHGSTRQGKTQVIFEKIKHILKTEKRFLTARYIPAYELGKMFSERFSNYEYQEAYNDLMSMSKNNLNILFLDDFDKIGTLTSNRINELYELVYNKLDGIEYIFITANLSIKDFCNNIGAGNISAPIYSRLKNFVTTEEIELK